MIVQNMHIHSKYSWDSKMEIEEIAKYLIDNNIKFGSITDHIEFNRESLPFVLTKFKIRNLEIDEVNKKYDGKLKLLKAAEISSPHLYKESVESLAELELDFLMGSIHNIKRKALTEMDKLLAYYEYYNEVLEMIKCNQVDVIGHLNYIDKYYDKSYANKSQIEEIINKIVENDMILEINTSAKRRYSQNIFPSIDMLVKYRDLTDEIIIGTDAHIYSELTDNLDQSDLIENKLKMKQVIFNRRKKEKI